MTTATAQGFPAQLTSFIGREREIGAVSDLLEGARLLTLTGVGGAGKTRLAAAVAARVAPRYEVTAWVDLASLADPALVGPVVATTLGFREESGRSAVETMVARVCELATFVVLDNCEHLVDACAALVEALLKGCGRIRILATSREALGVAGEQAWLVPPLSLPAAGDAPAVQASESGRLFRERARAVLPAFEITPDNAAAVERICRRLDGIPLAIELAAARVGVLAPEQLAARLDQAFKVLATAGRPAVPRHRTLREAIDWSHALLDAREAELFRRLAVFAGSFSLDAVEAVCPEPDVLDLLAALVDKSLVVMETAAGEARYRLLETLRQYAQERLVAADEAAEYRRRHAAFYTAYVSARERETFAVARDTHLTARLTADEMNYRAAGDWAEETGDHVTALRLAAALHWHWFARGQFRESWQRLQTALAHAGTATPLVAGKAFAAAATTAFWLGRTELIVPNAERAVALLRDAPDPWHLAYALSVTALDPSADPAAVEPQLVEATALARAHAPDTVLLVFALYMHGKFAFDRGTLELADRVLTEGLAVGRALGHPAGIAHPLVLLGLLAIRRGDLGRAERLLHEALRIHRDNHDALGCIWSVESLARAARAGGDQARAARLLAGTRAERERIGSLWTAAEAQEFGAGGLPAATESFEDVMAAALAQAPAAPPRPTPAVPPVTAPHAPRPGSRLDVRALGPLRITRDGEPLEREAWASAKARELLLLLLCHPDGRTREQVGLAFWPDASAHQVRNNFHVTLHRLRKTLGGPEWIELSGERYALGAAVAVELDAVRFEREATGAMKALGGTGGDAESRLESALGLYRGDFLEQEAAGDWHLELRDRLRLKFVEALGLLAARRMARDDWQGAAELWGRLLARDELDERAYRGLMTCHARLGERSQVQQLYQRLERSLARELDAKPDAETALLYRQLIGA